MNFRLANLNDVCELIKLRWDFSFEFNESLERDSYENFEKECRAFLQQSLEGNNWKNWVAEQNGQIVSHCYLHIIDKVPRPGSGSGKFGYITNVYTIPSYRSQNIGTQLLTMVENWSMENNLEFMILWPSSNSVNFYERNGFRRCSEAVEKYL